MLTKEPQIAIVSQINCDGQILNHRILCDPGAPPVLSQTRSRFKGEPRFPPPGEIRVIRTFWWLVTTQGFRLSRRSRQGPVPDMHQPPSASV